MIYTALCEMLLMRAMQCAVQLLQIYKQHILYIVQYSVYNAY
jgi:hypothetical protein